MFENFDQIISTHVEKALLAPGKRWILGSEMGLGKTAQAVNVLKQSWINDCSVAVIICPAIVRVHWITEIAKWWPSNFSIDSLTKGKNKDKVNKCDVRIVSYNLCHHVLDSIRSDQIVFLVLDEVHRLCHPSSNRYKVIREFIETKNIGCLLGLTGTPMPNKPIDACGIVELMWPERMGGIKNNKLNFKTKVRYSNARHNGYGYSFTGINEDHAAELKNRLSYMMSRTTKKEVAHLLPAFSVKELYYCVDDYKDKVSVVAEWMLSKTLECTHIAIMVHHRACVHDYAHEMETLFLGWTVLCITGEDTPEKRNKILMDAENTTNVIIVATMSSIGVGINLTFCEAAIIPEISFKFAPEVIIQTLGRFSRLCSKVPSEVAIPIASGSTDESILLKVIEKVEAMNKAIDGGMSETKLTELMSLTNEQIQVVTVDEGSPYLEVNYDDFV